MGNKLLNKMNFALIQIKLNGNTVYYGSYLPAPVMSIPEIVVYP